MRQGKRTSTQINPGSMNRLLLGMVVSCVCQAATVVTLGAGSPLASQVGLAARFYGLEVQALGVPQLLNRGVLLALANPDTVAVIVSGEALPLLKRDSVLSALRRASGESIPLLIVDSGAEAKRLAEWTRGAILNCGSSPDQPEAWSLRIENSGIAGPLANAELPFRVPPACGLVLSRGANGHVLAEAHSQAGAFPVFVDVGLTGERMFAAAGLRPLAKRAAGGQARRAEQFAGVAPVMMFLRYAAGEKAWHAPAQYANLTVDDPWLREPYGNLDYGDLAAQMKLHNFHTTVAFIPWNFDRSEPAVAALFRANPERFSVAIHGNNHNHREFDSYAKAPLDAQSASLKQALARMELFSRNTGVHYDPVMIFPHAVSPAETFGRLKELNYWATTNSENVPLGSNEPDDPLFPLRPETLAFNNFLSIKRVSAEVPVSKTNLAIDAFLGNPLLLYVHQEYFSPGADAFNSVADTINRIAPGTQWSSLGHIVQHLYLERARADRDYDILAFSPNLSLANPTEHSVVFHVRKTESFKPPIRSLFVDGVVQEYQATNDAIAFDVAVPAWQQRNVQLVYGSELRLAEVDVSKSNRMAGALRLLSDFRDNVLSRNAAGRMAIRLYPRVEIVGSFAILLIALLAGIGRLIWKYKKQKKLNRKAVARATRGGHGSVAQSQGASTSS
jgi:hypothetical protein